MTKAERLEMLRRRARELFDEDYDPFHVEPLTKDEQKKRRRKWIKDRRKNPVIAKQQNHPWRD